MLHKRIIIPVIERLDEQRAAYFGRVMDRLERHPGIEEHPSLPILVLKETIEALPIYLDPERLVEHLFSFVANNADALNSVVYSPSYLTDNTILAPRCAAFISAVVTETMATIDSHSCDTGGEHGEYHLSWPINPDDFPYRDPDAQDNEFEDDGSP